jgi:hypothetical protein
LPQPAGTAPSASQKPSPRSPQIRNGLGQIGNNQPTPSEPNPTRTIGYFCCASASAVAVTGDTSLAIGGIT